MTEETLNTLILGLLIIAGTGLLALLARTVLPSWRYLKVLNIFLMVIAWLSLFVILTGSSVSSWVSIERIKSALEGRQTGEGLSIEMFYLLAIVFGYIGVFMALIGGLVTKPRYLGIALMIIGATFMLSFAGLFLVDTKQQVSNIPIEFMC